MFDLSQIAPLSHVTLQMYAPLIYPRLLLKMKWEEKQAEILQCWCIILEVVELSPMNSLMVLNDTCYHILFVTVLIQTKPWACKQQNFRTAILAYANGKCCLSLWLEQFILFPEISYPIY